MTDDYIRSFDPRYRYPGKTDEDPYCINCDCPSAFSCRRFSSEPWRGPTGTIFIDPRPSILGGWLCEHYQPEYWNPLYKTETDKRLPAQGTPTRRAETETGSVAEGDGGPAPQGCAQTPTQSGDQ